MVAIRFSLSSCEQVARAGHGRSRGSVPLPGLHPAVNGEVVLDGRTAHMVYPVEDTYSLVSPTFILALVAC